MLEHCIGSMESGSSSVESSPDNQPQTGVDAPGTASNGKSWRKACTQRDIIADVHWQLCYLGRFRPSIDHACVGIVFSMLSEATQS